VRARARIALLVSAGALGWVGAFAGAHARVSLDDPSESRSVGSSTQGSLVHGHPIPPAGAGYVTYSYLGAALGRQYVHGAVRDLLIDAFQACAKARPDRTFVVGETGWPAGGSFWPHKTHANGLGVDVFMPLRDAAGRARNVPTWPWDQLGYGVELDAKGRLGELRIDWDELALLLVELDARAPSFGLRTQTILVAPEFVPMLLASPAGSKMGKLATAVKRTASGRRHDEHVHVEFALMAP